MTKEQNYRNFQFCDKFCNFTTAAGRELLFWRRLPVQIGGQMSEILFLILQNVVLIIAEVGQLEVLQWRPLPFL